MEKISPIDATLSDLIGVLMRVMQMGENRLLE